MFAGPPVDVAAPREFSKNICVYEICEESHYLRCLISEDGLGEPHFLQGVLRRSLSGDNTTVQPPPRVTRVGTDCSVLALCIKNDLIDALGSDQVKISPVEIDLHSLACGQTTLFQALGTVEEFLSMDQSVKRWARRATSDYSNTIIRVRIKGDPSTIDELPARGSDHTAILSTVFEDSPWLSKDREIQDPSADWVLEPRGDSRGSMRLTEDRRVGAGSVRTIEECTRASARLIEDRRKGAASASIVAGIPDRSSAELRYNLRIEPSNPVYAFWQLHSRSPESSLAPSLRVPDNALQASGHRAEVEPSTRANAALTTEDEGLVHGIWHQADNNSESAAPPQRSRIAGIHPAKASLSKSMLHHEQPVCIDILVLNLKDILSGIFELYSLPASSHQYQYHQRPSQTLKQLFVHIPSVLTMRGIAYIIFPRAEYSDDYLAVTKAFKSWVIQWERGRQWEWEASTLAVGPWYMEVIRIWRRPKATGPEAQGQFDMTEIDIAQALGYEAWLRAFSDLTLPTSLDGVGLSW